jgi:hypothetical protein
MMFSLIPPQVKIAAIAVMVALSFAAGWRVHAWRTDAALAHSIAKTEKTRQNDTVQADKIVKNVETVKEVIRYETIEIIKKVPALPDADHVCFTHDSLSLWNESIANANSYRPKPDDAPKTSETSGTDYHFVATVKEVITNAAENNLICGENAANHDALIDRIEALDGKMCYCAE